MSIVSMVHLIERSFLSVGFKSTPELLGFSIGVSSMYLILDVLSLVSTSVKDNVMGSLR
jgi:hypothetical protein